MARDYRETIAALRRKASDPAVGEHERSALLARADEMEKTHKQDMTPPARADAPFVADVIFDDFFGGGRRGKTFIFTAGSGVSFGKDPWGNVYYGQSGGMPSWVREFMTEDFYDESYDDDNTSEGEAW